MIKTHPLEELAPYYIDDLDVTRQTKINYTYSLQRYITYLRNRNIFFATKKDIIQYRSMMQNKGLKPSTIRHNLSVLRTFYAWLKNNKIRYGFAEIYTYNPTEGVKNIRNFTCYLKDPLSIEQATPLIKTGQKYRNTINGMRNYAILILMLTTGLRLIEVIRLKFDHISQYGKKDILYVHGKKRDDIDEIVKITPLVVEAINLYLYQRTDQSPYVFVRHDSRYPSSSLTTNTIRRFINKLFKEAHLKSPRITVHSLRHTCAYLNLQNSGSLEATQRLLRHQDIKSTLIYTHSINRLEDESEDRLTNLYFKNKEKQSND